MRKSHSGQPLRNSQVEGEGEIGQDLRQALARLIAGKPTNPKLRSVAEQGKLRINYSTVAKEAHHSRTLIGHDGCSYPEVRKAVTAAMTAGGTPVGQQANHPPGESAFDIIQRLRAENAILRSEKAVLATKVMEALAVARRLEEELKKLDRRKSRVQRRGKPNQLVGRDLPDTAKILSFPNDETSE